MSIPKKTFSFGSAAVNRFSPPMGENPPASLNIIISFEEALKLKLGLDHILMQLNSYNRSTKKGKDSAVNLCLYPARKRITISESNVKSALEE